MKNLPDIQQQKKGFKKLSIEKVGIRGIKVPLNILQKNNTKAFSTIATISSYCNLVPDLKGINMSRISRTINNTLVHSATEYPGIGIKNLNNTVYELRNVHKTNNIYIKANFDYLYNSKAPITKTWSIEPVNVTFESILKSDQLRNYVTVKVIGMSLCPCSKEMSLLKNNLTNEESQWIANADMPSSLRNKITKAGFGAHNQKSIIEVKVEVTEQNFMWIEDIIEIISASVSSPVWSTLKRPDEKWVTETSYMGGYYDENYNFIETNGGPMFVEDITRNIATELNNYLDKTIFDYTIIVNNQESIHSDNIMATAVKTAGRRLT